METLSKTRSLRTHHDHMLPARSATTWPQVATPPIWQWGVPVPDSVHLTIPSLCGNSPFTPILADGAWVVMPIKAVPHKPAVDLPALPELGRTAAMPSPPSPSPLPSPSVPLNWFRPAGLTWYVMRNGNGPHEIKNVIGAQILHWLLQQPNRPMSCREIARRLYGECSHLLKRTNQKSYADDIEEIDYFDRESGALNNEKQGDTRAAKNQVSLEMSLEMLSKEDLTMIAEQIRERKEELADNPPPNRRAALVEEIEKLKDYRNRATMPGRPQTPKKVNSAQLRLQKSLKNAVETVLKSLRNKDPALATYLNTPAKGGTIATGYQMVYRPPQDAGDWDLSGTSLQEVAHCGIVATRKRHETS